jgi:hypothetical protein
MATALPAFPNKTDTNQKMFDALVDLRAYLVEDRQQGVPAWSATETYITGNFVTYNGSIYRSLQGTAATPNKNNIPSTATAFWSDLFFAALAPKYLANGVDLNTIRAKGTYVYSFASGGAVNAPLTDTYFILEVLAEGNFNVQRWYSTADYKMFVRRISGSGEGVWGSWLCNASNYPINYGSTYYAVVKEKSDMYLPSGTIITAPLIRFTVLGGGNFQLGVTYVVNSGTTLTIKASVYRGGTWVKDFSTTGTSTGGEIKYLNMSDLYPNDFVTVQVSIGSTTQSMAISRVLVNAANAAIPIIPIFVQNGLPL